MSTADKPSAPQYDFDEIVPRRGTCSYKWDSAAPGVLPLWVADMDFRTAPPIVEALQRRVAHGIFGYTRVPEAYYDSVARWFLRRHGLTINRESVIYTSGVVPAVSAIIKALTRPGDAVVVMTPVYNCFFSSIRNNGCTISSSPLRRTGDTYEVDFDDLERRLAEPAARLLLLCNPHNPAGRVWRREELQRIGDLCLRHDVRVVSDEIHCELVFPGHRYVPYATLGEPYASRSVTCLSPSKAFNIAGLQIANIVATDADVRRRIDRAINDNEVCDVNPFGVIATMAAYDEGEPWLTQLVAYLYDNYRTLLAFCAERLPQFPIARMEGTYLAWMDCRALGIPSEQLEERLQTEASLWLNAGTMYGSEGEGSMRWNLACPRSAMLDGLERFAGFVEGMREVTD